MASSAVQSTIQYARPWLARCLDEHASCRQHAELATVFAIGGILQVRELGHEDRMPRRLLAFPASGPCDKVGLLEPEPTTKVEPYVALSHCWGPNEQFVMIREKIEKWRSQGLRLQDFPTTFRDAVEVTKALGYGYLWIDSLCILQDDAEDWKAEAPRMSIVYGNAACSIMAMDANDSHGGLFNDESVAQDSHRVGVLNSRAWVMQERMMSPRTLIYSQNRVAWECREAEATQELPELTARTDLEKKGSEASHSKALFQSLKDFYPQGLSASGMRTFMDLEPGLIGEPDDYNTFLRAWWQSLELYTACRLSHGADKFVAMNGLGSTVQARTRLRNMWGLWSAFLEHELLWSVDPAGPAGRRPTAFRAPSWSWASVDDGRVVNGYYRRLPAVPQLMIKPEIRVPVNTSFDQELPMPAWTYEEYSMQLHGDLRRAGLVVTDLEDGRQRCTIVLEDTGRWSDEEEHEFRSDARLMPGAHEVLCFLVLHYQKEDMVDECYTDIRLVLQSYLEHDDRIVKRVGYLETRYKELRDMDGINEDLW